MRGRGIATALLALGCAAGATVSIAPLASGAESRGVTLGGYTAYVSAAPVAMRLYEPVMPLPVEPQGELQLGFTQAMTTTGPDQRATASTVWPGAAVGDGFATITSLLGLGSHDYPVVANATYPIGKRTARTSMGAGDMTAAADGRVATATAVTGSATGIPESALSAGHATSTSTATLDRDRVAVVAAARASHVVLGGVIRIREVDASTSAWSTASTAGASGRSVVTGLSIAGYEFAVDEDGVHYTGGSHPLPGLPADPNEALNRLGITVTGQRETVTTDGATARYSAHALEITIDTALYKDALEATGYRSYYDDLVAALPKEIRDVVTDPRLPRAIDLRPRVVFSVGFVTATTAASPAYDVPLPHVPTVPTVPGSGPGSGGPGSGGGLPRLPVTPGLGVDVPPANAPVPAPGAPVPGTAPEAPLTPVGFAVTPELFGGLPPAVVALALLGALLAAAALRAASLTLGVLPGPAAHCGLGAATGVPLLRDPAGSVSPALLPGLAPITALTADPADPAARVPATPAAAAAAALRDALGAASSRSPGTAAPSAAVFASTPHEENT